MQYLVTLGQGLFALILAAYGSHLVAIVLDNKRKTAAVWTVWLLAFGAISMSTWQVYSVYRSDKEHDEQQKAQTAKLSEMQARLDENVSLVMHIADQLSSVAVAVAKADTKPTDPSLASLAAAVKAIAKAAEVKSNEWGFRRS